MEAAKKDVHLSISTPFNLQHRVHVNPDFTWQGAHGKNPSKVFQYVRLRRVNFTELKLIVSFVFSKYIGCWKLLEKEPSVAYTKPSM